MWSVYVGGSPDRHPDVHEHLTPEANLLILRQLSQATISVQRNQNHSLVSRV
jgi:hypothetical protein